MPKLKPLDQYSVSELLSLSPKIVRYFVERRLHCTGCPMARFETASDVAREYRLNWKSFQSELRKLLKSPESPRKGQAARRKRPS